MLVERSRPSAVEEPLQRLCLKQEDVFSNIYGAQLTPVGSLVQAISIHKQAIIDDAAKSDEAIKMSVAKRLELEANIIIMCAEIGSPSDEATLMDLKNQFQQITHDAAEQVRGSYYKNESTNGYKNTSVDKSRSVVTMNHVVYEGK